MIMIKRILMIMALSTTIGSLQASQANPALTGAERAEQEAILASIATAKTKKSETKKTQEQIDLEKAIAASKETAKKTITAATTQEKKQTQEEIDTEKALLASFASAKKPEKKKTQEQIDLEKAIAASKKEVRKEDPSLTLAKQLRAEDEAKRKGELASEKLAQKLAAADTSKNDQELPVPENLLGIVTYKRSIQQDLLKDKNTTCGAHALINSHAIRTLESKGQPLTSGNIMNESAQYAKKIKSFEHEPVDFLLGLGKQLGLDQAIPLYVLRYEDDKLKPGTAITNGYCNNLFDCYKTIKKAQNAHASFIININRHWVLAEVIKKKNKLEILYLNSLNTPLTLTPNTAKALKLLHKEIS